MFIIEFIAAFFTLLCVILTTQRNIFSWVIGIIAICLYAILFYNEKLYADFSLQIIFGIQSIMGYIQWNKNKENYNPYITKVEKLNINQRLRWIFPIIILYIIIAYLFDNYTDASLPYIDSLVAVLSLVANYFLIKRKIENWYIWIFVDIIYVGLFLYKGLILSSILYFILFILAIKGYKQWYKNLKQTTNDIK